jgi:hypothetical protein
MQCCPLPFARQVDRIRPDRLIQWRAVISRGPASNRSHVRRSVSSMQAGTQRAKRIFREI